MTDPYIDIIKVWTVNALAVLSNKMLEQFGTWNEIVQTLLTTILLLLSMIYTIYKIVDLRNKIQEDTNDT